MDKEKKDIVEITRTLEQCVTVYCSASYCKFKRSNSGYYNSCHNPAVLVRYKEFFGGRLYHEPCDCSKCEKNCMKNCGIDIDRIMKKEEFEDVDKVREEVI